MNYLLVVQVFVRTPSWGLVGHFQMEINSHECWDPRLKRRWNSWPIFPDVRGTLKILAGLLASKPLRIVGRNLSFGDQVNDVFLAFRQCGAVWSEVLCFSSSRFRHQLGWIEHLGSFPNRKRHTQQLAAQDEHSLSAREALVANRAVQRPKRLAVTGGEAGQVDLTAQQWGPLLAQAPAPALGARVIGAWIQPAVGHQGVGIGKVEAAQQRGQQRRRLGANAGDRLQALAALSHHCIARNERLYLLVYRVQQGLECLLQLLCLDPLGVDAEKDLAQGALVRDHLRTTREQLVQPLLQGRARLPGMQKGMMLVQVACNHPSINPVGLGSRAQRAGIKENIASIQHKHLEARLAGQLCQQTVVTTRGLHGNEGIGGNLAQPAQDTGCSVGNARWSSFRVRGDHQFGLGDVHSDTNYGLLHDCTSDWTICRVGVQHTNHVGLPSDRWSWCRKAKRHSVPDRRWKVGREKTQNCRSAAAAECEASPSTPTPITYKPRLPHMKVPPSK